jgi:PAS domain S-box-containing protein
MIQRGGPMNDIAEATVASSWAKSEDARMRWLLEAAPDATAIVDSGGRIVTLNTQLEELFGYNRSELIGRPIECLVPPRFRGAHPEHRREYAADPRARPMGAGRDLFAVRGDGSEFAAEVSLSSLLTPDGILVSVAVRDVSERKKVEDRFRRFVESAPDAIVIARSDGTIVLVNAQTEELFGYPRAELLGKKVEMLVPEGFRGTHAQRRREYETDRQVRSMGIGLELHGQRKDGSEFPVEISLSPLEADGEVLVSSAIRDLTERRKLDAARFQLAAIVDSTDDAIISVSLDGRIASWNNAAEGIFGHTSEEAVGQPMTMLMPEGCGDEVEVMLGQLRSGERVGIHDAVRVRKDGSLVDVSISMSAILNRSGALIGASKVVRDITQRKRTEASLASAMAAAEVSSKAFEAFSYSVAHDLRAPLRAIDGFGGALESEYGHLLDDDGKDYLRRVRGSARRMAELIDSLLRLARVTHQELGSATVDLSALATAALDRLAQESPDREVITVVQPGLTARGDAVLLANALDNLFANAWKFTRNRAGARIEFGREDSAYFVRDNGAGFDMAFSGKLFGVFQRLHTPTEFSGTGIGLATVQRIIQRHGGRIWAEGAVDAGATFHFTLAEAAR